MEQIPDLKEIIKRIQTQLRERGYEEKLISYEELQMLHKIYLPEVDERIFAEEILNIYSGNYHSMKRSKTKRKNIKKRKGK